MIAVLNISAKGHQLSSYDQIAARLPEAVAIQIAGVQV